jgi:predicted Zn-dependent protease
MVDRILRPRTPQQWLLARALACALAACPLVSASALTSNGAPTASKSLPDLGDGTEMSPAAERRLGDSIARSLYRDPDYVDDPVIAGYVQSIWQPLLDAARARGDLRPDMEELYAWDILLARDRSVNAFALPGGYFGLHLGLVAIVTTRDELASVLGHELSHVTQRHIARNISQQGAQQPWVIGAMILGMLAAAKSNSPDAANAMIIGGQAAAIQSQLNFSRDMEREADRVGFGVSTAAGFAPEGFVGMFEKLQMANRLNDSGNFPYLRSHPLTTERIADMQNRISLTTPSAPAPPAQWEPLMVAARARLLSNPGVDALRAWEADAQLDALQTRSPAQQAATLYGATLAAVKLREFDRVQPLLSRLQAQVRGRPVALRLVQLLGAEASMARGDAPDAVQRLAPAPLAGSAAWLDRAQLILIAQAQTRQALPQGLAQASQNMHVWAQTHPKDASAWRTLGAVYEAQGRAVAAIRAQAHADAIEQDWSAALARLRAAQDLVRTSQWGAAGPDFIEAAIVDTRAREIVQRLREQALQR